MKLRVKCHIINERMILLEKLIPDILNSVSNNGCQFYPATNHTGQKTIIRLTKYRRLNHIVKKGTHSVLSCLSGKRNPPILFTQTKVYFPTPNKTIILKDEQVQVYKSLKMNESPVLFQQAPAGTIITFMAALALWYWYINTENVILDTTKTNYAVQNLAKSLFECANSLPMGYVLFLQ